MAYTQEERAKFIELSEDLGDNINELDALTNSELPNSSLLGFTGGNSPRWGLVPAGNVGGDYDVSKNFPTGGVGGTNRYTLSEAIAKVPSGLRAGGMTIKFVDSVSGKYVEWKLTAATWSATVSDWQGVDNKPTAGSDNVVKSGGVFGSISPLCPEIKETFHISYGHVAADLSTVLFDAGKRIVLFIKSLPEIDRITISGNISYNDIPTPQYPQVKLYNGLGILDFVATHDGHLGHFGFQNYPGYDFDLLFEAYVLDEECYPLIDKINKIEEQVLVNKQNVEYSIGERTFSKTLAVSSHNKLIDLDVEFSEREVITIEIFTETGINTTVYGNVLFQDESRVYPQVNIVDGYGKVLLSYENKGKLEYFGFEQYTQDLNLKFFVRINEERQDTILNKTQNTYPFSDDTLQITSEKLTKNLTNIVFKAGQRIYLYISCNPNVSVTCYGNIFYNEHNPVYPKITVYEGWGYLEFVAAYDGNLGPFGLISYPGEDFDMNFRTFITNNDYPVLQRIDDIERTVQKAVSNIESSIGETVEERYLTISQYTKSTDLDVLFNANDTIIIEVFVNPSITGTINGNVKFTDESLVYPQVPVVDGYGKLSLKYNKSGKLRGFGVQNYTQDMAVRFLIHVIGTDENSIINNIESYNKTDFLPSISENTPVTRILETPGLTAIFRSWGFVGDSLSSGEMECYEGSTLKYVDMYEYSWGQHICRLCGSEGYNFSQGGQTARGWITGTGERTWEGARTNPKQAYIIALGVNDYQAEPGNINTDIDMNDYNNNANTFAGNYGGIIQRLRSIQPKCKIFVVTMPKDSNKNSIIRGMADKFDNVYIIDLYQYRSFYESSEFQTKYKLNGHLNPQGYLWTAYLFMTYIDWIIQTNPGNFKDAALIGTQYTPTGA